MSIYFVDDKGMATVSRIDDNQTSSVRVLVVEDSEPFRRFVCSMLGERPDLQIVCEVSDGLEAVNQAEKLQPDLILLDIGLPSMNGIEAARQIRKLSPESKMLFVSQESSPDVVQGALATGAKGYLLKMHTGRYLLTAVDVVLRGEQFVDSKFSGHDFAGVANTRALHNLQRESICVPSHQNMGIPHHAVEFYSDDERLLDDLTQFIGVALNAGNAAVVVATESHRNSLLPRLQTYGLDIRAVIEQGRYIAVDAGEAVSTFMLNRMPDPVRFLELFGNVIEKAQAAVGEQSRVVIFGEGVHLLCAQGNTAAAIQVEKLSNQVAQKYNVDILCGYSLHSIHGGTDSPTFQRICTEHSTVYFR